MSFRKQTGEENIPITSLISQRLKALNFVKQKTIKSPKPCQMENISSSKLRIYNKETREWWIRECAKFVIACMLGSSWRFRDTGVEGRAGRINLWLCLNTACSQQTQWSRGRRLRDSAMRCFLNRVMQLHLFSFVSLLLSHWGHLLHFLHSVTSYSWEINK